MSRSSVTPSLPQTWSAHTRLWVSILAALHFFCVLLAHVGLVDRSSLQLLVLDFFRPYTQLMNLDPVADPPPFSFQYADPDSSDVGYRIEWLATADDAADDAQQHWAAYESSAGSGLFGGVAWRQQRGARAWDYFSEADDIPAKLALATAKRLVEAGHHPSRIRCQRRAIPQPEDYTMVGDPPADYWRTAYEVRVVGAPEQLRVVRIYPDEQSARSRGGR